MSRTTLDIDASVLAELKERAGVEGKSMGQLTSELLAVGLARSDDGVGEVEFEWSSQPMGAKVDLEDKEAVAAILDDPRAAGYPR